MGILLGARLPPSEDISAAPHPEMLVFKKKDKEKAGRRRSRAWMECERKAEKKEADGKMDPNPQRELARGSHR